MNSWAGNNSWIVYILQCRDNSLYTGITNNMANRLAAHEAGNGARYTKGRGPFKVVYTEHVASRSEASKRELAIKAMTRKQKEELLLNANILI